MKQRIVQIQKMWRRFSRHKKLMLEINRRVAFRRQERFQQEMKRQEELAKAEAEKTALATSTHSENQPVTTSN